MSSPLKHPSSLNVVDAVRAPGETRLGERLRVAIVCREAGARGSVANVALRQAEELASRCRVALVSDSFPAGRSSAVHAEPAPGWRFGALGRLAHVPNEVAFCLAAVRALRRLSRSQGLDVALFHSHAGAALAVRRLRRSGLPIAMMTHGDVFERPPGTYDRRLTAFYRAVTPKAYRAVDLVLALTPEMAEWAKRGGAVTERVTVLPNGIDLTDLGLDNDGNPAPPTCEPPLRMLFVGRMSPEKGVGVLLDALLTLRQAGIPFEAILAGDGPEATLHREFVAQNGLAGSVSLIGRIPRRRLGELYSRTQVVCIPSLSDPLPTVALEALAMGRPVVGSAVGGIAHLVRDEVNGLLAPPSSAERLAERLARLATTPGLIAALAAGARPSVWPSHSWERIGTRLEEALREVATTARSAAA